MRIVFNDAFSFMVDEASENYINHTRQFWCKNSAAENINIDELRDNYLQYIPTEEVTSIKLYSEDVLLFNVTGYYGNLEINKFYLADGTCFLTLTLRKMSVSSPENGAKGVTNPEESDV